MISQLDRLCERLNITADVTYGGEVPEGWQPGTHPYKVTLKFEKRRLTVPFYCGPAHTAEPTAANVLNCLCSDACMGEETFESFCSELGYDTDSRKAERTWNACRAIAPKLRKFLRDSFDEVANAEH